jgi:hypothetical protein
MKLSTLKQIFNDGIRGLKMIFFHRIEINMDILTSHQKCISQAWAQNKMFFYIKTP